MAKKKKQPKSLTNEQAYEAYLADQDKKKQEQANGQVRYREAASASRVQYTNPTYKGNSENGNYKWETNALKDYKMPKGMGKSYNDKFKYMTQQMGMSEGQAQDFRTFMDYQEDKDKDKYALKRYEGKVDKDGKPVLDENGDQKLTKSSYNDGTGLHTKQEIIDGILSGMTSKAVQSFQNAQERQAKEAEAKQIQKIAKENAKADKEKLSKQLDTNNGNFLDDMLRMGKAGLESALHLKSPEKASLDVAIGYAKDGKTPAKSTQELSRGITRAANTTSFGLINEAAKNNNDPFYANQVFNTREGGAKAADFGYDALGYLISGLGSYKAATPAIEKIFGDIATKKISETAGKELIKRLGVEALRGGAAGTLLAGGEVGVKEGLNPENQNWKDNAAHVGTGALLGGGIDLGLAGAGAGVSKALSSNLEGLMKATGSVKYTDEAFQNALKEAYDPKGDVSKLIPEPPKPTPDEVFNQFVDETFKTKPPMRINNWQDKAYGKPDEQPVNNDVLWDAHTRRQAAEDDFVQQQLAPHYESQQRGADAQTQWQTIIKQSKDEIDRILGTHGKISVPKGALEDYPAPPKFRASSKDKVSNDIYKFAEDEGFSSPEEAVRYLQQLDADSKTRLKDLMPEKHKPYTEKDWADLEATARQNFAQSEHGKALDSLITDLLGGHNQTPKKSLDQALEELNAKYAGSKDTKKAEKAALKELEFILKNHTPEPKPLDVVSPKEPLKNSEIVNNSQVVEQANPSKKLSMDELNALVRGEQPSPKVETEQELVDWLKQEGKTKTPNPETSASTDKFNPLVRPNLQRFNTGSNPKLFTDGVVNSEKSIDTALGKFYENYVNSNHSFTAAHEKVLTRAIEKAKAEGKPKKAAQLEAQLKELKKSGSKLEQAVSNEAASGVSAKAFLKRHFKELDGIVKDDAEMADALTYMFAKDLDWRKANSHADYQLPDGVDWGQINDIINRGDANPKFKDDFVGAIRNLTQEWRDIMLDAGLISKEAHAKLSENPFYMPLQRDLSGKLDNIDRGGTNLSGAANRRSSGATIVHSMGKGDLESFYKNPIETLINNTFAVYKNAYKEETHRQILNLAQLDKDGLFFKEITPKQYQGNTEGGIKIANDGNPRYVRIQKDLMKVLDENDEVVNTDVLGKLTNMFAGLKTRSLEYQMTAAYRDLATNYLTSQITNPFRYIGEAFRSIKNGNKDVKAIGGYFDKAYNDHVGGVDPAKVMDEFKKSYGGTVESFSVKDPKSWRKAAQVVGKYLDMPFKPIKKLGEITDEIPRDIEARETERLFMKKNGEKIQNLKTALDDINNRLAQAEGVTDPFDPRLQGIDKLQSQKAGIERMLTQFDRDLKREQLFRSRDVINYQRHGRGGVAKKIRQWVVFANTTTQSKDKVIRSFIERPGATLFKTALLMSPFITAQKIMHETMSDSDKETYNNLPNYVKQMNYVFVNDGKLFTVPKVQELALISDPIEAMLQGEPLDSSARMAIKEAIPYQAGNFAQGLVPAEGTTPIQNMQFPSFVGLPIADVMANSKIGFNQKPVSYGAKFSPKDAKANDWTLDVFKNLMGDKPGADRLQYLTEQYLGDYGKYLGRTADYVTNPTNTDKLDELLRYLNPIQDRYYNNDSRFVKPIPQETKK